MTFLSDICVSAPLHATATDSITYVNPPDDCWVLALDPRPERMSRDSRSMTLSNRSSIAMLAGERQTGSVPRRYVRLLA